MFTTRMGSYHLIERGSQWFPLYLRDDQFGEPADGVRRTPNLSDLALGYIESHGATPSDLFHHALATLHDPAYRAANVGGLRLGWPRIPLPDDRQTLIASAERGRTLARLLDTEAAAADLLDESIAVPTKTDGSQMEGKDFNVTAGWGRHGASKAVMPGQGKLTEHPDTVDVWLNDRAYWRNIPHAVWQYRLGGYQVLKKWLSYREHKVLGRALSLEEAQPLLRNRPPHRRHPWRLSSPVPTHPFALPRIRHSSARWNPYGGCWRRGVPSCSANARWRAARPSAPRTELGLDSSVRWNDGKRGSGRRRESGRRVRRPRLDRGGKPNSVTSAATPPPSRRLSVIRLRLRDEQNDCGRCARKGVLCDVV